MVETLTRTLNLQNGCEQQLLCLQQSFHSPQTLNGDLSSILFKLIQVNVCKLLPTLPVLLHHAAFAEHKLGLLTVTVCVQLKRSRLEMTFISLYRYPPFFDDNPFGIYQKILAGKLEFPRHLDFYVK